MDVEIKEVFDCVVSYGVELFGKFPDQKGKDEILKSTNGFEDNTGDIFIRLSNSYQDTEVDIKEWKNKLDKKHLGNWCFSLDTCMDEKNHDCLGKQNDIHSIIGSIYISNITTNTSHQYYGTKKAKKTRIGKRNENSNENSSIALINIVFMDVPRNFIAKLFENAQNEKLILLKNSTAMQQDKKMSLVSLLNLFSIRIITTPKTIVSGYSINPMREYSDEIIAILAHESDLDSTGYHTNCRQMIEYSQDNLSNYSGVFIVASDCCIVQQYHTEASSAKAPENPCGINLEKRYENLVLTVFITNVILARITKLRFIQELLGKCFVNKTENRKQLSEALIYINLHIVELSFMWRDDIFTYPITGEIARRIHSRFGLNRYKSELDDLKQTFENYMNMFLSHEEKISKEKWQNVLMALTIISGLTVLQSLGDYLFSFSGFHQRLLAILGETFILIVLITIYVVYRKYKDR